MQSGGKNIPPRGTFSSNTRSSSPMKSTSHPITGTPITSDGNLNSPISETPHTLNSRKQNSFFQLCSLKSDFPSKYLFFGSNCSPPLKTGISFESICELYISIPVIVFSNTVIRLHPCTCALGIITPGFIVPVEIIRAIHKQGGNNLIQVKIQFIQHGIIGFI